MSQTAGNSSEDWRDAQKIRLQVPWPRRLWDHLMAPFRITVLSEEKTHKLGLSSLKDERIRAVFPYCKGRLLDLGCGKNNLAATYGPEKSIGVDIYDWNCGALILSDTSKLPFDDKIFDTVTFLACLNHVPNREDVLRETARVLKDDGCVLITMPRPLISQIAHRWWELLKLGEDWVRDWHEEEVYGFTPRQIQNMLEKTGFQLSEQHRFLYGFNYLYVARKAPPKSAGATAQK